MTSYRDLIEGIGAGVDGAGVLIIIIGACLASGRFLLARQSKPGRSYRLYRQDLGRAILLGLEFLVAGDIIRTVAVAPTMENVAILGLIVLIRTFLSMALQLELDGRLPWQLAQPAVPTAASVTASSLTAPPTTMPPTAAPTASSITTQPTTPPSV